jgi:hypothetical protein
MKMYVWILLPILLGCFSSFADKDRKGYHNQDRDHEEKQRTYSNEHRIPGQTYIEDSAHVYWDSWPNPFSPPTITDTGKGLMCGTLTFYCDLSDSVEVAVVTERDSVVYSTTVFSPKPPYFDLCYWVAGPKIDRQSLPSSYFRAPSDITLRLVLVVGGRWKNSRVFFRGGGRRDWYYWIDRRDYWMKGREL